MLHHKPIIGLSGGIGSGKSHVASLFASLGCLVLDSDAAVRRAYQDPAILASLKSMFGPQSVHPDGTPDRRFLSQHVFADPARRKQLESLLHPYVASDRDRLMNAHANDPNVVAFVWDIPLLFDIGLHEKCDALVFVDTDLATRLGRVAATRNWPPGELQRRESAQFPLDRKRALSHYVIRNNTADAATVPDQVRDVLSRILRQTPNPI